MATTVRAHALTETPLLPPGFTVPTSRWTDPATRLRELLDSEPYVFAPGIYDSHGAEIAMYHRATAIYFSGYSFAIGHLGTTDMDLYSGPEIADGARRTVAALRKFQLTMALGDPEKGVAPKHLEIPPVVVDMDGGYGNLFNVQRTADLYVNAGVAAAHIEDQVLPKRCGHIAGKALISADEMVGKLRMMRAVADDLGRKDFVIIARTDAVSAVDAPDSLRGMDLAIDRALRYLDSGVPDMVWCEFPTSDRKPTEQFANEVRRRFPDAKFAFNWSSSFKWFNDPTRSRSASSASSATSSSSSPSRRSTRSATASRSSSRVSARNSSTRTSPCSRRSGRSATTSRRAATTSSPASPTTRRWAR